MGIQPYKSILTIKNVAEGTIGCGSPFPHLRSSDTPHTQTLCIHNAYLSSPVPRRFRLSFLELDLVQPSAEELHREVPVLQLATLLCAEDSYPRRLMHKVHRAFNLKKGWLLQPGQHVDLESVRRTVELCIRRGVMSPAGLWTRVLRDATFVCTI